MGSSDRATAFPLGTSTAFPLLCAAGGALLLTHNHSIGNIKEELLAEMSHAPIALLGATAGCSRWLELRLPDRRELPARLVYLAGLFSSGWTGATELSGVAELGVSGRTGAARQASYWQALFSPRKTPSFDILDSNMSSVSTTAVASGSCPMPAKRRWKAVTRRLRELGSIGRRCC